MCEKRKTALKDGDHRRGGDSRSMDVDRLPHSLVNNGIGGASATTAQWDFNHAYGANGG